MLAELFTYDLSDGDLDRWLEQFLGPEAFHGYDEGRLSKHFEIYKVLFKALDIPILIVGGTNGKGETSLFLEKLCLNNNINSLLWTSPHIVSVRERFSASGKPIASDELSNIFKKFKSDVKELSYYEFLFKCFCEFVKCSIVDGKKTVIILEVGLGGRLDATNFFDSNLSILTSISRDHTAILGNSLESILKEKIAIARRSNPLFSAISQGFLKEKVAAYCRENEVELFDVDSQLESNEDFHKRNEVLAQNTFLYLYKKILKISHDAKLQIEGTVWARPLRVTYKGCQFILLGSHNLDGLRYLAQWAFRANSCDEKLKFDEAFFGFSRQEETELVSCLKIIEQSPCLGNKRRVFAFDHQRATPKTLLKRAFTQLDGDEITGLILENEFQGFIENFKEDQTVLVSGSYYFISFFLKSISKFGVPEFS